MPDSGDENVGCFGKNGVSDDFGSEVHISQEQLGVFVGAARESVNRQLQLWRKDGILDLQRGRILLQNIARLTTVARNE